MKEFTADELKKLNGGDGPAHVVVDGKVYDVSGSGLWSGGEHMGRHRAGADLTAQIEDAPHGREVLERVKEAGTVSAGEGPEPGDGGGSEPAAPPVPGWAKWILGFHPHPIAVHFPQATFVLAPLFLMGFYLTGKPSLERTAYYLLICGVLTAVPAFLSGLFHWIFKYAKAPGAVYKFKIFASQLLIVLSLVTAVLHTQAGRLSAEEPSGLLAVLYLFMIPVAAAIGHAGGIIVFGPRK